MQIAQTRSRAAPAVARCKRYTPERARAEALFNKPVTVTKPRILEDAPKPAVNTAVRVAAIEETEHEKVFRLVRESRFEEAARIAARLINAGNDDGFFIYGNTPAYERAESWLAERIERGRQSPGAGFETITPERAQLLLLNNDGNRKVRIANLAVIMRDITSGRWEKNGETLIVSDNGLLNDGQHRNFAVLLTGRSIETAMAFGVTRESIVTIDTGAKRTGGDRLGFLEVKNYSRIAAIIALVHKLINGRPATEPEKVFFYRDHAELLQSIAGISNGLPRGSSGAVFGSAAFILLKNGFNENSLSEFFAEIRGASVPKRKNSPAIKIREALLAKSFKAPSDKQVYTVIDLYLKWAAGKAAHNVTIVDNLPTSFVI